MLTRALILEQPPSDDAAGALCKSG